MERQIDTSIFISREGAAPGHVGILSAPEATFHHRRQKSRHVARAGKEPFNSRLEHQCQSEKSEEPGRNRFDAFDVLFGTKRRPEATFVDAKVDEAKSSPRYRYHRPRSRLLLSSSCALLLLALVLVIVVDGVIASKQNIVV